MTFAYSDDLLAELMAAFSTEAAEQLQALNEGLLTLERGEVAEGEAEADFLREIFRHAHTLKGGAAAVDLPEVRELAHHLESLFALLQSGEFRPNEGDFDVLYRTLDAIEVLIESATTREGAPDVDVAGLAREIETLARTPAGDSSVQAPPGDPPSEVGDLEEVPVDPEQTSPEPEPDQSSSSEPSSDRSAPADEVVRISISKLDTLMSEVGELIVARNATGRNLADLQDIAKEFSVIQERWRRSRRVRRLSPGAGGAGSDEVLHALLPVMEAIEGDLERALKRLKVTVDSLSTTSRRADKTTTALHDDMRAARMLPLQSILASFPRMVRDLAREQGKEVRLQVMGAETELDRAVLEQIKGPLIHLLRNCIDHGLEEPPVRRSARKPEEGTILVSAAQQGDSVRLEIADDGRGIDPSRVRAAAVAKGLLTAEEADDLGQDESFRLIFRSGLSTSAIITDVSGRGVGLDVVRENVERLGGTVHVDSDQGQGTRFSLLLPLTVALTRCLLVRAGAEQLAVPINNIVRVLRVAEDDVHEVQGGRAIRVDEEPVMLADLAHELEIDSAEIPLSARPALLVAAGEGTVALAVDEVSQVQELVVKSLPQPLAGTPNLTGAAILDTGDVVLVLNVADVARASGPGPVQRHPAPDSADSGSEQPDQKVILLADDSLTTRTLEKNILQAAGYDVVAVSDGADAWDLLQADGADLLVSDVQMPRMDGFELTQQIRSDPRFQDLPVILVTSLDSPADRRRGIEAGADAYIVKSGFDQEHLIDVIRRLV